MKKVKFTKEELAQVNRYLDIKELCYVDLRYEIMDHILLDIEHEITHEKVTFEEAFKKSCDKWKGSFYSESSYWLGISFYGPRIFIDKCVKINKPFFLILILSVLLLVGFGILFKPDVDFELLRYFSFGLTPFYIVFMVYWWIQLKMSQAKTSFSFLFLRYAISNFIINSLMLFQFYGLSTDKLDLLDFVYLVFVINGLYQGFYLYKNHQKEVSQFNKYKLL